MSLSSMNAALDDVYKAQDAQTKYKIARNKQKPKIKPKVVKPKAKEPAKEGWKLTPNKAGKPELTQAEWLAQRQEARKQ